MRPERGQPCKQGSGTSLPSLVAKTLAHPRRERDKCGIVVSLSGLAKTKPRRYDMLTIFVTARKLRVRDRAAELPLGLLGTSLWRGWLWCDTR